MLLVRLVVGAWLCVAPLASAQRVVMPVEGLGRAVPLAPVYLPPNAPALLAPSLVAPALQFSLIPTAATPALVPVAAAAAIVQPLKLTAVAAAVAQFQKIDLRSAPAAEARGGADAFMARVLGAEVAEAPALAAGFLSAAEISLPLPSAPEAARPPAPGPRVHLLSKPLHETVELGPAARVLHYVLETGFQFVKASIAWHATGSISAGLAVLAFDLIKMPPMITAQSLTDLSLRYWWRKLTTLREIAKTPGVTRIRVLTTGETSFTGILARRQENTGLIFVDAERTLPAVIPGFGTPIPVADLSERHVRLVLVHDGVSELSFWLPTLGQLLTGQTLPAEIAKIWRTRLGEDKKDKTRLQRLFDFSKEKELMIEAHLSDGNGGESPLGTIAFGRSVKRLIGTGRWDRVRALFGAAPVTRAIPLSDTVVERGGNRSVEGFARRVWRRLTGRLIVRP